LRLCDWKRWHAASINGFSTRFAHHRTKVLYEDLLAPGLAERRNQGTSRLYLTPLHVLTVFKRARYLERKSRQGTDMSARFVSPLEGDPSYKSSYRK
jgi:hypothetical protein